MKAFKYRYTLNWNASNSLKPQEKPASNSPYSKTAESFYLDRENKGNDCQPKKL